MTKGKMADRIRWNVPSLSFAALLIAVSGSSLTQIAPGDAFTLAGTARTLDQLGVFIGLAWLLSFVLATLALRREWLPQTCFVGSALIAFVILLACAAGLPHLGFRHFPFLMCFYLAEGVGLISRRLVYPKMPWSTPIAGYKPPLSIR